MTFTLSCNNQTINAEVIKNSFSKTEVYWNKLKQADNGARFQAVFTIELSNFIKTHINEDIQVEIKNGTTNEFFGYVRKNVKFTKTQINQPIAIEVVSPSFMFDKTIGRSLTYINKTLGYIVEDLVSRAGFNSTLNLSQLTYSPKLITVSEGETFKEIISELLYEYGYGWDFDENGVFFVFGLFDLPSHAEVDHVFNDSNCLNEITIAAKDQEYDCVKGTYEQITEHENALIFRDTTGAGDATSGTCSQKVLPKSYFAGKQFNYLDCDSEFGEIKYINSISPNVTSANSTQMQWEMSNKELNPESPNYNMSLGTQLCFTAYNSSAYDNYLTRIDCNAHIFVANANTEATSYGNKKTSEITLKYICEESKARDFVAKLTNWYRYANNTISLTSKLNYALGSFVKITAYGIGTYYGRIIQKQTNLMSQAIAYTIETFEEYTPATIEIKNKPSIGGINQSSIDSAINQSNQYTQQEIQRVELQASPQYSVIYNTPVIRKGNDGAYSPSVIKATAYKTTDVQERFVGDFEIKINGEPYGVIQDSSVSLNVEQLLEEIGSLNTIEFSFKTTGSLPIVISEYTIPVLTGSAAYSISLETPGTIFEADVDGKVTSHTVKTKAHVYYGLQELEYLSVTGWEYGSIIVPEGFHVSVDVTGEITIINDEGVIPEYGRIKIPVFIHSQTNTENTVGYESGARAVVQMYVGYGENYEGYLSPDENGFFDTYFTFQKLTEGAIKLAELNTKVEGYWNVLTSDLTITVAEKNVLERTLESITAEYSNYSSKYSMHRSFSAYALSYTTLKREVEKVLSFDGNFRFNSVTEKNAFNALFEDYYSKKALLDNDIATVGTNFTKVDSVNRLNTLAQDAKVEDYFVWTASEPVTVTPPEGDAVTFIPGMTYKWNGVWWTEDNNNEHIMATMSEALEKVSNSSDETVPAVTFAKRLIAMKVIAEDILAKYVEVKDVMTEGKTTIDGGKVTTNSIDVDKLIVNDAFMDSIATRMLKLRENGVIRSENWNGNLEIKTNIDYERADGNIAGEGDYYVENGIIYVITNNRTTPYEVITTNRNETPKFYQLDPAGKYISIKFEPRQDGSLFVEETVSPPGSPSYKNEYILYKGDSFVVWGLNSDRKIIWDGKENIYTHTLYGNGIQEVTKVTNPYTKVTKAGTKGFIQLANGYMESHDTAYFDNLHIAGDSVFEGTVNARDGVFNGTVNATNGVFNGTVNASNGVFRNVTIAESSEIHGMLGFVGETYFSDHILTFDPFTVLQRPDWKVSYGGFTAIINVYQGVNAISSTIGAFLAGSYLVNFNSIQRFDGTSFHMYRTIDSIQILLNKEVFPEIVGTQYQSLKFSFGNDVNNGFLTVSLLHKYN